jgi:glyoxylase-like metal-dependent hydrolase (beta-lactamase superfamily II)
MIPFVRELAFKYGRPDRMSPLIRRVIAQNPGAFTFTGTGAHIVGHGEVAVVDPGPDDPRQVEAILKATKGERSPTSSSPTTTWTTRRRRGRWPRGPGR